MLRTISIILLLSFFFTSTVAPVAAAISYSYDANGNMISDGTRCFEYNDANQLKKVKSCANNQTIAEYLYDHTGKRLVKKEYENGTLKQTIYSPTDEYETKKLPNGTTENTTYFKVNDEVVAKKNPDGSLTYFHNDHLGSTSVLTNQSAQVVEKTSYEPYGEVKAGGTKSKWGYTGQEKDSETGLNYYDARYYDPHIHRFTQPDTLLPDVYDPQQLNRYTYANNNPIKCTDPSGHVAIAALVPWFIGAAISGVVAFTPQARNATKAILKNAFDNVSNLVATVSTLLNKQQTSKPTVPGSSDPGKTIPNTGKGNTQQPKQQTPPNMDPLQKIAPLGPTFSSQEKLVDHFERHAGNLGVKSMDEYLTGARNLIKGGKGIETFVRSNGEKLFFKKSTGEFGSVSIDGQTIKTYFKPENPLKYWTNEAGKY